MASYGIRPCFKRAPELRDISYRNSAPHLSLTHSPHSRGLTAEAARKKITIATYGWTSSHLISHPSWSVVENRVLLFLGVEMITLQTTFDNT